jgi:hypothetical protein
MVAPFESETERKVCALALIGYGVRNIKLQKTKGYPDRLFWIFGGRPLLIEFKRRGCLPHPGQLLVHKQLRHAGYDVETHDNVNEALASIRAKLEAAALHEKSRQVAVAKAGGGTVPASWFAQNEHNLGRAVDP